MTHDERLTGVPRALMLLAGGACAVIVLAGIRSAAGIVGPVFFAIVLTLTVFPLRQWVQRRGLPGWVGTLVGVLSVYVVLVGLTVALILACGRFATMLPTYEDQFDDLLSSLEDQLHSMGIASKPASTLTSALDPGRLVGAIVALLANLVSIGSNLLFVATVLLFVGLDAVKFRDRAGEAHDGHPAMTRAIEQFARGSREYLRVATVFGGIVAVLDMGVLFALDVPSPLLWGLLAFITGYIPNIGFLIGMVPPAVIALLEGGVGLMLAVVVAYIVINSGIQTVLQPRVVGKAVGLSSTVSFLSLVFWSYVLGAYGALMAVPLSLFVKAFLIDVDPSLRWLSPMISGTRDEPEPIPGSTDDP